MIFSAQDPACRSPFARSALRAGLPAVNQDGTRGGGHHPLGDRTQQRSAEPTPASVTDDQEIGRSGGVDQHPHRVSREDVRMHSRGVHRVHSVRDRLPGYVAGDGFQSKEPTPGTPTSRGWPHAMTAWTC